MRAKMQKSFVVVMAVLGGAWLLTMLPACHTVEGAGRDVQAIGEGVERGADSTRPYDAPR